MTPQTHSIGIRCAAAADRDAFLHMWDDFIRNGAEPCGEGAPELAWERICDPGDALSCLVSTDGDDTPVGFVLYLAHPYTWSTRLVCYLLDLYVSPAHRGQGRGRALVEALAEIGRRQGWLKIYWMTQADNEARALYDSLAQRSGLVRYDRYLNPA